MKTFSDGEIVQERSVAVAEVAFPEWRNIIYKISLSKLSIGRGIAELPTALKEE
jgi:hypothetical protein